MDTDVTIAAHAKRENHYAILVSNLKISYVFKYKISITLLLFLICLEKSCLNSSTKVEDFCDNPLSSNTFICFWNGFLSCPKRL